VVGTAANVNDVTQGHELLHGDEEIVFADAGYQGAMKRPEATGVRWHVAMRPGKRRALDLANKSHQLIDEAERLKASVRAKVGSAWLRGLRSVLSRMPWWRVSRPVRMLARLGEQSGVTAKKSRNCAPSAATRSRWGVRAKG